MEQGLRASRECSSLDRMREQASGGRRKLNERIPPATRSHSRRPLAAPKHRRSSLLVHPYARSRRACVPGRLHRPIVPLRVRRSPRGPLLTLSSVVPLVSRDPFIYEINTWVWLRELRRVGLADVPVEEWDAIRGLGFDAVWLMGVWDRELSGRRGDRQESNLGALRGRAGRRPCRTGTRRRRLGSPYASATTGRRRFGGGAAWRSPSGAGASGACGCWSTSCRTTWPRTTRGCPSHPDYFVRGSDDDPRATRRRSCASATGLRPRPRPLLPAWPDVVQLNLRAGPAGGAVDHADGSPIRPTGFAATWRC